VNEVPEALAGVSMSSSWIVPSVTCRPSCEVNDEACTMGTDIGMGEEADVDATGNKAFPAAERVNWPWPWPWP
jgi:hypothetical protein